MHTHSLSFYRSKIHVCFDLCHEEKCEILVLEEVVCILMLNEYNFPWISLAFMWDGWQGGRIAIFLFVLSEQIEL
jgi:hypothetical protein